MDNGGATKLDILYMKNLDELLRQNPNNFDAMLRKGILSCEPFRRYSESEIILDSLIEKDPSNIKAYFWQAECLGSTGDYKKIQRVLEAGLLVDPKSAECHFLLANALYNLNEEDSSIEFHYRKAIELEPSWLTPRYFLTSFFFRQDKLQQARKVAELALTFLPDAIDTPKDPIEETYEVFITGRCGHDMKKEFTEWLEKIDFIISEKNNPTS